MTERMADEAVSSALDQPLRRQLVPDRLPRRPPADRRGRHRAGGVRRRRDQRRPQRPARGGRRRRRREGPLGDPRHPHAGRQPAGRAREGRQLGPAAVRAARAAQRRGPATGLGPRHRADRRPRRLAPARPADRAAPRLRRRAARHAGHRPARSTGGGPGPSSAGAGEVRRAGRPRGGHRARARAPRRAGAAGHGRPDHRPQRQRPAEPRQLLAGCQQALVEGFGAAGMWIQTFDEDGRRRHPLLRRRLAADLPPELVADRRARRPPLLGQPEGPGRGRRPARRPDADQRDERDADPRLPRRHRRRLAALRAARRRPRVPRQPGADPRAGQPDWTEVEMPPPSTSATTSAGRSSTPAPSSASTSWSRSCRRSTPTRAS